MKTSFVVAAVLTLTLAVPASGVEIVVDIADDLLVDDDACSLREAIIAANTDKKHLGCPAGNAGDTIVLKAPGPYYLSLGGDLDIWEDLRILGNGRRIQPLPNSAFADRLFEIRNNVEIEGLLITGFTSAESGGAILVGKHGTLDLESVYLFKNRTEKSGGAIHVEEGGELSMTGTNILRNRAQDLGGGFSVEDGLVTVKGISKLAGNEAARGGGLSVGPAGRVEGIGLAIRGNRADQAAGFLVNGGSMRLERADLEGNRSQQMTSAGHIDLGEVELVRSRIQGNHIVGGPVLGHCLLVNGGGLHLVESSVTANHGNVQVEARGTLRLVGSLVANNSVPGVGTPVPLGAVHGVDAQTLLVVNSTVSENDFSLGAEYSVVGATEIASSTLLGRVSGGHWRNSILLGECLASLFVPYGHNVMVVNPALPCKSPAPSDIVLAVEDVADLNLGPLEANGGWTETHALLAGSPAIDKGNPAGCVDPATNLPLGHDQTGQPRHIKNPCDIGAFEHDPDRKKPPGSGEREQFQPADRAQ